MALTPDPVLDKARDQVARSFRLIDRQEALINAIEQRGRDSAAALALHYAMYRGLVLMIESLDCLESAALIRREPRRESLDEWLQMLTLAWHPQTTKH